MVLILKWGPECFPMHSHIIWVRSRNCRCLVTWFCYQLIAKPGNKTAAVSVTWPIWAFPSADAPPHFTASHTCTFHACSFHIMTVSLTGGWAKPNSTEQHSSQHMEGIAWKANLPMSSILQLLSTFYQLASNMISLGLILRSWTKWPWHWDGKIQRLPVMIPSI